MFVYRSICSNLTESSSNGCEDCFLEWRLEIECLHVSARRLCCERKRTKVCKLVKSLYVLKQVPHAWYEKLTEHLLKLNFEHFDLDDATLFIKKVGRYVVYLVVYVDDLLMTGNNESYIASIKKDLKKIFEMTDMGHLHYYLGIEVTQHPKYIFLSQKKYVGELLSKFSMIECNPISTPMEQK